MGVLSVIFIALAYVLLLFGVAWWVDKNALVAKKLIDHPWVYALSMAVYCTAWTFYGSVGRAATGGLSFMSVYLGPALLAPLWYMVLYKMILIAKNERVGSIADFISARYGKSGIVGILATIVVVLGIIPYISIQIQSVDVAFQTLTSMSVKGDNHIRVSPFKDTGLYITVAMALFAGVFGTRKLDPNERHEGLIASIALESLVKLVAFLTIGIVVTFGIFGGFSDLFLHAAASEITQKLFSLHDAGVTPASWFVIMILSLFAFILLPRQFHVAVVENNSPRHVRQAMWLLPLYLLLINIFVLPIALAGKMLLSADVSPDSYVLSLPLAHHMKYLAILVFIGGFSAAISMVVIETTALSIMLSNQIFVPLLIHFGRFNQAISGARQLLNIRRFSIVLVLFAAYFYERNVTKGFDIVSIGLISFAAVAQLAPSVLLGMYWRRGNQYGAIAGMTIGFLIWAYCLPLPSMAKAGVLDSSFIEEGAFNLYWLKPYALFGIAGWDPITNGTFWSLFFNLIAYAVVSEWTHSDSLGLNQADRFVNVHKYTDGTLMDALQREAPIDDLRIALVRFFGQERTDTLLHGFQEQNGRGLGDSGMARPELVRFAELQLTGVIGAASARVVMNGIARAETVSFEEVIQILEQTREAIEYSKVVESKNIELSDVTNQLREANMQLQALDRLKADFITSVTHELRTPVTSIMAFSKIILTDYDQLSDEKQKEFLGIVIHECERISRMINQVLDLEKMQSEAVFELETVDIQEVIHGALDAVQPIIKDKAIDLDTSGVGRFAVGEPSKNVRANRDQMMQVLINLFSNAVKFCPPHGGKLRVSLRSHDRYLEIDVEDNGHGIAQEDESRVFERFTQIHPDNTGKPHGTGLGLYISKKIIEQHHGQIWVTGQPGRGAIFHIRLPAE